MGWGIARTYVCCLGRRLNNSRVSSSGLPRLKTLLSTGTKEHCVWLSSTHGPQALTPVDCPCAQVPDGVALAGCERGTQGLSKLSHFLCWGHCSVLRGQQRSAVFKLKKIAVEVWREICGCTTLDAVYLQTELVDIRTSRLDDRSWRPAALTIYSSAC